MFPTRRKIKELDETTAHIKIVREKQRPLLFQCSLYCNLFYKSRIVAHQKGEKRKECSSAEIEFSLKYYEPNLLESERLHHFREGDFF